MSDSTERVCHMSLSCCLSFWQLASAGNRPIWSASQHTHTHACTHKRRAYAQFLYSMSCNCLVQYVQRSSFLQPFLSTPLSYTVCTVLRCTSSFFRSLEFLELHRRPHRTSWHHLRLAGATFYVTVADWLPAELHAALRQSQVPQGSAKVSFTLIKLITIKLY